MQDVVDTLFDCDVDVDLSSSERRGLETILDLARDIIDMEDKINNIISNSYERIIHEKY
jgi:hypothetical protein